MRIRSSVDGYKPMWNKDGVVQFKNEFVAILQTKKMDFKQNL